MESSRIAKKIGKPLAETSKRHGNTFAETHQGDEKKCRADDCNSHKMRPYRTEAGATIEDRPGKHTIFGKVEKSFIVALSKMLKRKK